jgi:hypothetical protein
MPHGFVIVRAICFGQVAITRFEQILLADLWELQKLLPAMEDLRGECG